jgi:hypothetical protein
VVQRDALRLDPQNVVSLVDVETTDQSARNAAPDRLQFTHRTGAEAGLQCGAHGVASCFRYQSEFLHGPSECGERPARDRAVSLDLVRGRKTRNQNPVLYLFRTKFSPASGLQAGLHLMGCAIMGQGELCCTNLAVLFGPVPQLAFLNICFDAASNRTIGRSICQSSTSCLSTRRLADLMAASSSAQSI